MNLPIWIFGEDHTGDRQFLIHTGHPRFIAEVFDILGGDQEIKVILWLDQPEPDVQTLARLMREAGEALAEYDQELGGID